MTNIYLKENMMRKHESFEELEPLLQLFVGDWIIEGLNSSFAPNSVDTPLSGTQHVIFMESGRLVEAHWKYEYKGGDKHYGISIIGKAQEKEKTECHNFDNIGFHRVYDCHFTENTWVLTGKSERATIKFDKNGMSYKEFWEVKKNGKWQSLCERIGVKTT